MVVIIKQMKTFRSLTLFSWVFTLSLCFPAKAQVYTNGIVGYINEVLFAGDNLIANQLGNSDNTLIFEKLGWAPSAPLEEGLRKTYAWIASQVEAARPPQAG